MATPLRTPVVPQPPAGPPMSLLDAAITPDSEVGYDGQPIGDRWEGGFTWQPRQCGIISGRNDCNPSADVDYRTGTNDRRSHQPVIISSKFECSTMGADWEFYRRSATDQLIAAEPVAAEQELWEGTLAAAAVDAGDDAYSDNLWLAKHGVATDLTGGTGVTPARAVGLLEQFLADTGFGSAGMIHLQPQLLAHLYADITVIGQRIYTARRQLIVAGSGYTGTGPEESAGAGPSAPPDGTVWAYATGLVTYRNGPIQVIPDNESEAVMRAYNDVTVYAQRSSAGTWDSCAVGAVLVTLPA